MAIPATKQQLLDYCKRQLGAPVVEINVDDDQADDRGSFGDRDFVSNEDD